MRKLAVVMFAVGSLFLMAFPAYAEKGDMAFGVNGGVAVPMGALAEEFDPMAEEPSGADMTMGFGFGVFFDYFVTKEIAIGADLGYAMNSMNDQEIMGETYEGLLDAKTMHFGVHGKYFVPTGGPLTPYLGLGLGMYNRKLELSEDFQVGMDLDEEGLSDNVFGINAGVGVVYRVSPAVGIGVNGAYHYTMGEFKPEIGNEEVEVLDDWNYISFQGAVTFYFPMAK